MEEVRDQILTEIINIVETYEGDALQVKLIEHQQNVDVNEIDNFITEEVYKCVCFYHSKNKLNEVQALEIASRACEKLKSEKVTSEYKIKSIVKDFIIHVLSRDLMLATK